MGKVLSVLGRYATVAAIGYEVHNTINHNNQNHVVAVPIPQPVEPEVNAEIVWLLRALIALFIFVGCKIYGAVRKSVSKEFSRSLGSPA